MSASTPKTILLAGDGCHKEAPAGAALTPGMLVDRATDGDVIPHGGDGISVMQPAFALENDLVGKSIGDAYATGENVLYKVMYPGAEVYAIIADGEAIAYGDNLTSNGDGTLREAAAGEHVVAIARGAVTTSGATARLRVEVASGYVLTT